MKKIKNVGLRMN